MAEEREKAEKAKTAELAKQIQQEREEDEFDQIAAAAGGNNNSRKKLDRGIDWMYTGHRKDSETAKADAAKQAEEFLLGKEFHPAGKVVGDLDLAAAASREGVNAVVVAAASTARRGEHDSDSGHAKLPAASASAAAPHLEEDSVTHRNEAFRMRHEDPMYAVSLQAVRKEKSVEHRRELYEKAGMELVETKAPRNDETKGKNDREHKKKKKEKKHKKRHRKRYYSSDSDGDDSYDDARRRNSKRAKRHNSPASYDSLVDGDRNKRDQYSPRRKRSRSRSVDTDRYDSARRKNRHDERKSPPRSRRDDVDRYGRGDDRKPPPLGRDDVDNRKPPPPPPPRRERSYGADREHPRRSRSPDLHRRRHDEEYHQQHKPGYGLQGSNSAPSRKVGGDLGPDQDLLQRRRQEKEAERRQRMGSERRYRSAAEREDALRAMERDAARHASMREGHHRHRRGSAEEEDGDRRHSDSKTPSASFLHEMRQEAHGLTGGKQSLSDRLQQNRNTNQRNHESFL
jgi:hypothetical protein